MKTMAGAGTSRSLMGGLVLLAALLVGGCRHPQAAPTLPAILQAPELPPPAPANPPMKAPPPEVISKAPAVKVTQTKPRRTPKKNTPKATEPEVPAPVETAVAGPVAEASPIGELSAGSDASPKVQQAVSELIVASEARLNALPSSTAEQQQAQIRKVLYFLKQARQVLSTGDAEGAKTLATKAKLLLDDLTK